jgi:hypothetical protein
MQRECPSLLHDSDAVRKRETQINITLIQCSIRDITSPQTQS